MEDFIDFLKMLLNIIGICAAMFLIVVVSVLLTVGGIATAVSIIEWILGGFI